jgi:anti-anti-sigma factor
MLEIQELRRNGVVELALRGELDQPGAELLRSVLNEMLADEVCDLVLDMHGVEFMDSAGLGGLLDVAKAYRAKDCTITLRAPSLHVTRVVQEAGVTGYIEVEEH